MTRAAIAVLLLAAALAQPVTAGEKKVTPKLTEETKSGAQITRENIVKMKIKTVHPQPIPPTPSLPALPPQPPNP